MERPSTARANLIAESAVLRNGASELEPAAGECKRDEESLRRSEARHRALVEHAACGIYRSILEEKFLTVNPALARMLGYESATELLQVDLAKDVYAQPSDREKLLQQFGNGAHTAALEVVWKRKDGRPIAVHLSGRRVPQNVDCFDITAVGLSDKQNLEAQLRQAQKMEVVGQLTGGIAHDFNNLLTVIQTNMGIIDCVVPPDSLELQECLEAIRVSTQRGAVLIKKLLSFSREQRLERRPLDLPSLIEELSATARRIVPETIEIQIRADQPVPTVEADPSSIQQILFNLITNARDAMPDGGVLTIEVGITTLDAEYHATHPWVVPGQYASVVVSDSGMGMDEETQQRVFEPFFTTKRADKGTGLGMAMVYGLMKEHRGYVDVSSDPGAGTTVELYFPVSGAVTKAADRQLPAEKVQGGTETILVIEDEAAIRHAVKRALESHGYSVLLAADGQEGLDVYRARRSEIRLVVCDLVMPRLHGLGFYKALQHDGASVKVLFTSGYSASDMCQGGELEPGLPFLQKPWLFTELLARIRDLLN